MFSSLWNQLLLDWSFARRQFIPWFWVVRILEVEHTNVFNEAASETWAHWIQIMGIEFAFPQLAPHIAFKDSYMGFFFF